MLRVSLKGVWAHKVRLVLTALAIILGVGLISGVYVYTDTIGKAFDGIFADAYSGVDIAIGTESDFSFGEGTYLDEADFALIDEVPGVEEAYPYLSGHGCDRPGRGGRGPEQRSGAAHLRGQPVGSPEGIYRDTGGFTIAEGAYPVGSGQVALDRGIADLGGFEVGDRVTVISDRGRPSRSLAGWNRRVRRGQQPGGHQVGVLRSSNHPVGPAASRQAVGRSGAGHSGGPVEDVIAGIQAVLPDQATVVSGQDAAEEEAAEIQAALSFFTIFLSVFGWVALFVGSFLIYNTFRIVVSQRTRELALLRALGAGTRQVRGSSCSRR